MNKALRRFFYGLLYACYLIGFVLVVMYGGFYRGFVRELRADRWWVGDLKPPKYASAQLMQQVGSLMTKKSSSFVNFARDRPAGTTRVCGFGDSYTYGDETMPDHDIFSFLQARFRDAGLAVEVINFGSSWHGFHQSFMIWETLGTAFGCQYLVLGPGSFQLDRDTSFSHSGLVAPYYLHARYVLEGNAVRLQTIDGATPQERFDDYYQFLQPLRYLRYDRNLPVALQAVIGRRKRLTNPFYYRSDPAFAEALLTYGRLLARMAKHGASLLLLTDRSDLMEAALAAVPTGLLVAAPLMPSGIPYVAPRGHRSAAGNRVLADQLFDYLVGAQQREVLKLHGLPEAPAQKRHPTTRLSEFKRATITLGTERAGALSRSDEEFFQDGRGSPTESPAHTSLVLLHASGTPPVAGFSLALRDSLPIDGSLVIKDDRLHQLGEPLGALQARSDCVQVGSIAVRKLEIVSKGRFSLPLPAGVANLGEGTEVGLFLDSVVLALGRRRGQRLIFHKTITGMHVASSPSGAAPVIESLPPSGPVSLHLEGGNQPCEVQIGRYTRNPVALPQPRGRLHRPIQ